MVSLQMIDMPLAPRATFPAKSHLCHGEDRRELPIGHEVIDLSWRQHTPASALGLWCLGGGECLKPSFSRLTFNPNRFKLEKLPGGLSSDVRKLLFKA